MKKITRRDFLGTSLTAVSGAITIPLVLHSCRTKTAVSDRILIAHIGQGSRGQEEMKNYFVPLDSSYSVATCDPFRQRRDATASFIADSYREKGVKAPECQAYRHFEEVIERDDVDAVHITTPDHWHVPLAIKAARAGKHIMLAKPLGLSYSNYLILQKELKAAGVRFHYGTQQRSMKHMQMGIQMIREGLIGEIERVEVWAPGYNPVESPVCQEVPVPEDFDFDLWTGPAPLNPYCPERVTNNGSWFQWDYSIGFLAGWGAHPLDVMVWGIKDRISGNYTCEGTGGFWKPGGLYNNIRAWDVNIVYDSGVQLHFTDADFAVGSGLISYRKIPETNGTTFYGSKGWISLSRNSAQSDISELDSRLNAFPKNASGLIRSEEHTMGQLFVDVVRGNIHEVCPLDEAILSDCISHMSNIAIRTARKITWDPGMGTVVNDPEANAWFHRKMREPYTV